MSVKRKDTEKVFAIYPNVCYNIPVYSPYTAKKAGTEGLLAAFEWSKKRLGVFIGILLFLSCTLVANRFVFRIDIVGYGRLSSGNIMCAGRERHPYFCAL